MLLDYALFILVVVLTAIEVVVYFSAIWWHNDGPKDPRNGL